MAQHKSLFSQVVVALIVVVVTFVLLATKSQALEIIPAKLDTLYTVNSVAYSGFSNEYQYDNVFGPVVVNDNFQNVQVVFRQLSPNTTFDFSVSSLSGKVLQPTTIFGKVKLSMKLYNNPVEWVLLKFNAPHGIFNVDMYRSMQAYIYDPSTFTSELTVLGDKFGFIKRDVDSIKVELHLPYIFQAIEKTEIIIILGTEDSPLDPIPLVDNRWLNVPYAASYAMKLESNPSYNRYLTIGFPAARLVDYMLYPSPRFILTEANNIRIQDIVDTRFKKEEIVILKSYMFETTRALNTDGSYINYDYIFDDLKDIAGEDVEIKFDTVTCASTFGKGYSFGQPIKPAPQSSIDTPGRVTCTESVIVTNSLIVIYAKAVMIKRPKIDALTNGERVESAVSRGFGKFANIVPITQNTCVTFSGSVTKNPLTIYMLQQELSKSRNYASPNYYTSLATLPVGDSVEAKFCTNETFFKEIGKVDQEMDFAFFAQNPETVSEFELISSISTNAAGSNAAGAVIGILFALGVVFGVCGLLIAVGVVFWWKKKRSNYNAINE